MSNPEQLARGLQLFQQARELRARGNLQAAATAFAKADTLIPVHPAMLAEYGSLAEELRDDTLAAGLWQRLGRLRPESNFEGRLGLCLFRLGRYGEAIPFLQTHCRRYPDDAPVRSPLALSLLKELRWEDALAIGRGLLAGTRNGVHVELVMNCLYNLGRKEELDGMLEAAIADFPDDPLILALCGFHLLKRGDFARGFGFQPAIRRRYFSHKPDMRLPAADGWDGKPFDGVLLLDGEQGLGEEILCASMFGELVRLGQRTVVGCDPRLIPLFQRSFPSITFVSRYGGEIDRLEASGIRHHRFYALDLACLFRRRPFLHDQPWLLPDMQRVEELRAQYDYRCPGLRRKAISWRTVREVAGAPRSIRLTELAPLFRLPGIAWFNVQYGDYTADLAELAAAGLPLPWDDLSVDQTQDIDGLAAQLYAFGALVSISNTTVHLAGALGVNSHLILPKTRPVMWYWGYEGERTPWYPSIRIHRNAHESGWEELAQRLANELAASPKESR